MLRVYVANCFTVIFVGNWSSVEFAQGEGRHLMTITHFFERATYPDERGFQVLLKINNSKLVQTRVLFCTMSHASRSPNFRVVN